MKNSMMSNRFLALLLAAIFILSAVTPTLANDEKKAIPVELRFIGNIDNQPVFQLSFDSKEINEFVVVVRDEFNNVLYKDVVKGIKNSKRFLLNTDELGDAAISFEITGGKDEKPVIYEVNKKSRMVQDVVISKRN
jgi:hypothetical protein